MDDLLLFRRNLKMYLDYYGIEQKDLARELGISASAVSKWVVGKSTPNFKYLDMLCRKFQCTRSQLLEIEMTPKKIEKSKAQDRLMVYLNQLNRDGVNKVLEYIEDLNPKYFKEET